MILFGLTGGIGMGKSTCANWISARGIPTVDADDLAREMVKPGQAALEEVVSRFGSQMLEEDGSLDRARLAQIVFADAAARADLEAILHPSVRSAWQSQVVAWEGAGQKIGVVVIPLLFETSAECRFASTICVACSAGSQMERLQRRGWSSAEIQLRNSAQWPIVRKMEAANYVVWNEFGLEFQSRQLSMIFQPN